jgi:hypothetical protein
MHSPPASITADAQTPKRPNAQNRTFSFIPSSPWRYLNLLQYCTRLTTHSSYLLCKGVSAPPPTNQPSHPSAILPPFDLSSSNKPKKKAPTCRVLLSIPPTTYSAHAYTKSILSLPSHIIPTIQNSSISRITHCQDGCSTLSQSQARPTIGSRLNDAPLMAAFAAGSPLCGVRPCHREARCRFLQC